METKQVKEIIEIFEASNLSHMELEEGNLKTNRSSTKYSCFTDRAYTSRTKTNRG